MDRDTFDKLVMVLLAIVIADIVGHFIPVLAWYWIILIQAFLTIILLFAVFALWEIPSDIRRKHRTKRTEADIKLEEENFKRSFELTLDNSLHPSTKDELIKQALLKRDIRKRIADLKRSIEYAEKTVESQQRYIAETQEVVKDYEDSLNEGTGGQV